MLITYTSLISPYCIGNSFNSFLLSDDRLGKCLFKIQILFHLRTHHLGNRNTCPSRDNFRDIIFSNFLTKQSSSILCKRVDLLLSFLYLSLKFRHLAMLNHCSRIEVSLAFCILLFS